ncbi:MAG: hypothetical protein Q9187_005373 [Circinaria calcarea]
MAPVCTFWQRGHCKNGDNCRFEHPAKGGSSASSYNRFGVLNSESPGHGSSSSNKVEIYREDATVIHDAATKPPSRYQLDKEVIITDLSKERPQWILSAYGPGRSAPVQLFGGLPREQSFEELRLRHYELAAAGNQQQAIQEAQVLVSNAEQQMQTVLRDVDGAIKYIIDGEKEHPNRLDVVQAKGTGIAQAKPSSTIQQPPTSFGQPSTFGKPTGLVGLENTAFGQPSTFGQPTQPTNPFTQPSNTGKATGTFGQQTPAFGQPAPLGRPTTGFGQASSTFGQPSNLNAPAFGQPSNPSTFGQPSNPFARAPSGPKSFINQPVPASTTSAQGANVAAPSNPFGQPKVPQPSTFGQPTQPSAGVFGKPTNSPAPTPFGQPPAAPKPFNQAPPPAPGGMLGKPIDASNTRRDGNNRLTMWKGQPVTYIDNEPCYRRADGSWEKIWFPNGAPVWKKPPDLPDDTYDEATKASYLYMREHGTFKDGVMPELPPKREWCRWDF